MTKAIALGKTVRDKVTGFSGIASSLIEFMTGNVQFVVQGEAKDGAIPDGVGIDAHQLELVEGGKMVVCIAPAADTIVLGEKVKDMVIGVEGIAIRRTTFINGCIYYTVVTEKTAKITSEEYFIEGNRLDRSGAGVLAKIMKKLTPAPDTTARAPGGPMTRPMMRG